MKVQDLFETLAEATRSVDVNPVLTILNAVEAAMDRSSEVRSFSVHPEEVFFSISYDFPEHRIGVAKTVRAATKTVGKLNAQQGGGSFDPGIDFQLLPTTPLTDKQVNELTTALKGKYPEAN